MVVVVPRLGIQVVLLQKNIHMLSGMSIQVVLQLAHHGQVAVQITVDDPIFPMKNLDGVENPGCTLQN